MILAPQQGEAIEAVEKWLTTKQQVFKLFGYAGSGKTTLAKYISEMVGSCMFVAYTGKAALVLAQKGCVPSSTIHRAIYKAHQDEGSGKWYFNLDYGSPLAMVDLVIVDEGPMVGAALALDLLKIAKKVLVLGDPFQLEPVKDEQFWGLGDPDFMLTDIHRQAADNPIIRMSMDIRMRGKLDMGKYGDSLVAKAKAFEPGMLFSHAQAICGKNDTRHYYNALYRKEKGMIDHTPTVGERLICLRNENERGFLNGQMWQVDAATREDRDVKLMVHPWGEDEIEPTAIITPIEYFEGQDSTLDWRVKKSVNEFCYAYTITCHKSQGSQFNSALIFDQSRVFKDYPLKWLYTAVTRAEERVTVLV